MSKRMELNLVFLFVFVTVLCISTCVIASRPVRKNTEKLRVLVDKVLTRGTRELTDEQAGQIAKAGFNAVSYTHLTLPTN